MNMKPINEFRDTDDTRSVLVIEDNPGDYALVEDFLFENKNKFTLKHAQTCKEAKAMLSDGQTQFDVILLDLSLPDKTGIELINEMIAICQATPVIVLTGYESLHFGVKSLSLGIADYLLKDGLTPQMLYKSILYSCERKKAILDLEESEKRYSNLFHLSPEPMWVYTIDNLCFEDVNDAAIKHYGYSKEDFLNMTIGDIKVSTTDKAGLKNDSPRKIHAPGSSFEENITMHRKKNGELICVEENSSVIEHKGKKAKIVFANDVSERLNYVAAIEAQNEKLREIAWVQSHVVRAPLSRLMGLIDVFKNHQNTAEETCMIVDYLVASAHELDDIIKDISDKVYDKIKTNSHLQVSA
jgi:PAS domain S-box-containing protein